MKLLTYALQRLPEFQGLLESLKRGLCPIAVTGLAAVHRAHFAGAIRLMTGRPVVCVVADETEGEKMVRDLETFTEETVPLLATRSFSFFTGATVSHGWEHRRLDLMNRLMRGEIPVLVATVEGLLQRTMPPGVLQRSTREIRVGDTWDMNELTDALVISGYSRCEQVEGKGQFAVRGGILDVFPPNLEKPVRVEFFGDEVDTMGIFDPDSQRRMENISSVVLLPAREVLPHMAPEGAAGLERRMKRMASRALRDGNGDLESTLRQDMEALRTGTLSSTDRYLPLIYPEMATAADFMPRDTVVAFFESSRIGERARTWQWQAEEDVKALLERGQLDGSCWEMNRTYPQLISVLERRAIVYLDAFSRAGYPSQPRDALSVTAKQLPASGNSPDAAAQDLEHYQKSGFSSIMLASGEQHALDMQTQLRERNIKSAVEFHMKAMPPAGAVQITVGGLSAGMEYPTIRLAVLTEGERSAPHRQRSRKESSSRQRLKSYADLVPGDLVIHEHHGLGRYVGMVKMQVDGVQKDYVKLAYAGTDVLYVPATQLDLISKYIGGGEDNSTRRLNRLGGQEWEKAKSKAKKAVQDMAKELVKLYAQRQHQPGYAFSPDNEWQREFENSFEYTETDDQLRATKEIKHDMELPRPMDRLLCGDVGYGKTEVAFRAVMKCILDGKQAAILAPTTVLARQHYLTAVHRFQNFPVNIDVLSRFRTGAQTRDVLKRLREGKIDLLVGTHRLFNKDVVFKDLGLLVIDEEQRFGVAHKERLKETYNQVDVLTLSATPIPRTLNMAMSGIRDMSVLEEPPADRQPVQTYVLEHDWGVVADAMRRELERGGQVFYLYNRVETISRCAAVIQAMLGEDAIVAIAHGRMGQDEIDEVMSRMTDGEINILVCTTIIETGIDLPNVNTLIIEDADRLGLAQLHQIRGRVGRSSRRAFAYFTYRKGKILSEVSEKRLAAIREYAEFGSGFKIAMRDLEIRGAGNLLGPEQSGFLLSVGYDMYLKMLEEAVITEQGLTPPKEEECGANLTVPASVPENYVPSAEQRMDLYRRIAALRTEDDADELVDELIDRYGDPPRTVNNLIAIALLRADAAGCGFTDIDQRRGVLTMKADKFNLKQVSRMMSLDRYQGRMTFNAGEEPSISYRLDRYEDPLKVAEKIVRDYKAG